MDCYKILGLSEGADEKEIKRAYFKLVRQYSPEHDPERFQEIREAYERLTAGRDEKTHTFKMEFPATLLGKQMKEACEKRMEEGEYRWAISIAEEANERFGESEGFLYYLAFSQMRAGNTGKAVKNYERLTGKHPEKLPYRRELALAYQERGFGNKAYQAFQTAYDMGCRDQEFLLMFSLCCNDRDRMEQGCSLLKELVANLNAKYKDNMDEAIDAFTGMFMMGMSLTKAEFSDILEQFRGFLHAAAPYLGDYERELFAFAAILAEGAAMHDWDTVEVKRTLQEIKGHLRKDSGENEWKEIERILEEGLIWEDERLGNLVKNGFDAFVMGGEDAQITRFMQLDMELCMTEEWPAIRSEIEVLKEDYAEYYGQIRDFIQILENTNDIRHVRERLQNEYDRREKYIAGGVYYERYPHRRRGQTATRWDSDEEGTYVRSQPKVGRNDPCPCGSGKKYKNCCGKK